MIVNFKLFENNKEWQEKNGTKEFIIYHSSNKEDLEAIIQAKKYNI